ncbi:MAG: HAMP domain-containing histidine kinase, partial [Candidatus Obscuribacterales bacterium]|nr:HAMP domain-containing histidine kinase [Candidatus Obscuribacterales bacterium]
PIELSCHNIDTVDGDKFMVLVVDLSDKAEIEKLKQEFVMILSHELRTPLTSLQLLLGLLSEGGYGELTERGYTKVSVAERNITRLVKLIQELLDFETIESEKLKMELLPCDLKETLVRAVEASRGPASSKNIELESEFGDLEVVADGDRLIQVVINFIANAVKYSPEGESVLIKSESDGAYALVSVIDRGPGIGKEYCQMIFERFKQVDPAASKGKGNVGLGLAISKAIIDRHGGIIGVNSEVGKGSTFWFRIPIAKSQK